MPSFPQDGYEIHRRILDEATLHTLREEANAVAQRTGSSCIRHLRRHSKLFDECLVSPALVALISPLQRPVRSILFDKTPQENWPVLWHQDLTIAVRERHECEGYGPWSIKEETPHVQPPLALLERMVTMRLHLDATPAENGALKVVPGSHRLGRIRPEEIPDLTLESVVTCACQAGDIMLMSPLLLHSSSRSMVPQHRRVIHVEFAPSDVLDPRLQWYESA